MTDIRNDPKSGESVMDSMRKGNFAPQWGKVPEGKVSAADFGVQPDNQLSHSPVKGRSIPTAIRHDPRGSSDLT